MRDAPAAGDPAYRRRTDARDAVNFLSHPVVARLLWALPLLLVVIGVATTRAGMVQREVAAGGQTVQAEVLDVLLRERSEITRGEVRLRYTPPGADTPVERAVEMPLVLLKELEADYLVRDTTQAFTVPLLVAPGTDQVVLGAHPRGQWMLTFSLAAMAFVGALVAGALVAGWNRLLAREGDPAERIATSEAG